MSKTRRFLLVRALTGTLLVLTARAQITISDFSTVNTLTTGFGSWTFGATDQFESFTDGLVSGQQVVPLGGGNPTGAGFAIRDPLSSLLDLSSQSSLAFTLRLLPANAVSAVSVKLQDFDGTDRNYEFSTASFNTTTFATAIASLASGTTIDPGADGGDMDFDLIVAFRIQGIGESANFRMQLDHLEAVPEPSSWTAAVATALLGFAAFRQRAKWQRRNRPPAPMTSR